MNFQRILIMQTEKASIRANADGWSFDDSSNIQPNQKEHPHIGIATIIRSKFEEFYCYDCPLRALANGWRLMAPPLELKTKTCEGLEDVVYEWWFEKF